MNLRKIFLILLILLIPIISFAYSKNVYVGGENIGIEMQTNGVLVVGLYKINGEEVARNSNITIGDYIISVNNHKINNINDFSNEINNDIDKDSIDIGFRRNNKIYSSKLKLYKDNDIYKTGLFVKDSISGIGTLTLVDPNNNKFLALGHGVYDTNTSNLINISSGDIYSSYITSINRSSIGNPGEKVGTTNSNDKYGEIYKNTDKGIYGKFNKNINKKLMEVASKDEINIGNAKILTVLDGNKIKEYDINIIKIDYKDDLKNLLFTITDKELLDRTGGIVQGMSGSPIIQNNKIIGAVTHVIIDEPTKGYGIFITNMLEETDKD